MTPDTLTEPTALILAGDGYQLTISPEAEARKLQLIDAAAVVTTVTSNDESASAQAVSRKLAAMRIDVEKSRKAVKEPVNRIGKLIDATAKNFLAEIEAEEKRITKLVGDHAAEVARLRAEKEAEERRAFEAARAAREEAERAAEAAGSSGKLADIIAAKQAEAERQATLAARMEASAEVATTNVAEGVRFAWDFEVDDISALYHHAPNLVSIEPKRSEVLKRVREIAERHKDDVALIGEFFEGYGIRVFQKPVVSSR